MAAVQRKSCKRCSRNLCFREVMALHKLRDICWNMRKYSALIQGSKPPVAWSSIIARDLRCINAFVADVQALWTLENESDSKLKSLASSAPSVPCFSKHGAGQ